MTFAERYGRTAVVAGASEGLGAAFAQALASKGLDLVLLARRREPLEALAAELRGQHRIEATALSIDVGDDSFSSALEDAVRGREIGLGVYNAAYSYTGALLDRPLEDALRVVDVNVRGPLRFVHAIAGPMRERKRGGIVLMSSVAGFQGAPRLAAYAASKAFNAVLAESLWSELRPHGVDVVASCAGAIRTPGYRAASSSGEAPGTLDPIAVAERTLAALGGGPLVVPGAFNKVAAFVLRRLLPRRSAVAVMARSTRSLD